MTNDTTCADRIRELGMQVIMPTYFLVREGRPIRWSAAPFMPSDFAAGDEEVRFDPIDAAKGKGGAS